VTTIAIYHYGVPIYARIFFIIKNTCHSYHGIVNNRQVDLVIVNVNIYSIYSALN